MTTPGRSLRTENIEFTVKATEDLVLPGVERSIVRVIQNNTYSCLMLKNQRFSSLFRHYSKHHGLPRESLEFCFTSKIGPDDTPDTIFLQHNDIITVRHTKVKTINKCNEKKDIDHNAEYFQSMKMLLKNEDEADVVFQVGPDRSIIRAHRLVLTTHSEFFSAMLRRGGSMRESVDGVILIEDHSPETVRRMLEYIYSNSISDMTTLSATELIELIELSELYLLPKLKIICQEIASEKLNLDTAGMYLAASERFGAKSLKKAALDYIISNAEKLVCTKSFCEQIENYPSLAMTILRESAQNIQQQPSKKRRLDISSTAIQLFNEPYEDY